MSLDNKPSIYHADEFGTMGTTIKLNMIAVRQLLDRPDIAKFDNLTDADRETLQLRFTIYLSRASTGISHGQVRDPKVGHVEIQPNLNHLPDRKAVKWAVMESKLPPERRTGLTAHARAAARRKITDAEVWRYHLLGKAPQEIALYVDISLSSIYSARRRVCAAHGVAPKLGEKMNGTWSRMMVRELSSQGKGAVEIAEEMGMQRSRIDQLLRDLHGEEVAK